MKDGTRVTLGSGSKVYKAFLATGQRDWNRKYTLVPEGGGRKRYQVSEDKIVQFVPMPGIPIAHTSVGSVRRPKSFRKFKAFSGGCRKTHIGKNWVFKIQHSAGDFYNAREAALYQYQQGMPMAEIIAKFGEHAARSIEYYKDVPVAECYLLKDGVLMMERVRPVYNLNCASGADQLTLAELDKLGFKEETWMYRVDSDQIGYDRHNRVVAYDL